MTTRTGGQAALQTAADAGIEVCFANAGTTEIHLVEALDTSPTIRSILGLFEGVCSGAADGYARIAGKPALGLFHLGPGFANSAANQHNARRAWSPVVNLIGDQASWHLAADAPLTSDIDAIAGWAGWSRRSASADDAAATVADAIAAATTGTMGPASAILAADHTWETTDAPMPEARLGGQLDPDDASVSSAASALSGPNTVLILGGHNISSGARHAAARIRHKTGCRVYIGGHARTEKGRDQPDIASLPYFPEPLTQELADVETAVLAGPPEPVCFFGYRNGPSKALPDTATRVTLCTTDHDLEASLLALAERLGADTGEPQPERSAVERPSGELHSGSLAEAVLWTLPENAIIVQEAITSRAAFDRSSGSAPPFTQLNLCGGAIGEGLPLGVGAAVAAPDRRVINYQADGSGLYTIQSLWTMAREQLDITVVIINNRKYKIIEVEAQRADLVPGAATSSLLDLDRPEINFAEVASGFGMPSARATTADDVVALLETANAADGPFLIDAVL